MQEIKIFIFYDIEQDSIRYKVSDICKDYGLERMQYSGFTGHLRKNLREELYLKLKKTIKKANGKFIILPLCEKDVKEIKECINAVGKK